MAADNNWQEIKAELEAETQRIFLECPDEIKRFHYGVITHSDAGKYAKGQYFGHWTHVYAEYYSYAGAELSGIISWASDPEFTLAQIKKIFMSLSIGAFGLGEYGGQKTLGRYAQSIAALFDSDITKEEMVLVLKAYQALVSRLYWWVHWYFPWGIGPVMCRRLEPEDIREIVRLSEGDRI